MNHDTHQHGIQRPVFTAFSVLARHVARSSCMVSIYYRNLTYYSATKRDRGLRHIKRCEIPRLAIVIRRHFSTSRTKLPSSRLSEARIWLVQDQ